MIDDCPKCAPRSKNPGQEADTGEREEERRAKSRNYRARSSNKSFTKHYLSERSFRARLPHGVIAIREKLCREKEKERKRERKKEQSNNDVYIDTLAAIRK